MRKPQNLSFHKLLRYTWAHSTFYREYYAGHGIKEKDLDEVTVRDLPFITKKTLMENFDAAVTDPRLRKMEIEKWLQDIHDPQQLYRNDFIVLHTSGSSGEIAIFVYDLKAWRLMNATVATRFPPPENGLRGKTRVACYLASHGHFGGVTTAVQLAKSVYDVRVVSLEDATEHVVEQLNDFQPHRLCGYSSSVAMLAESAIRGNLDIHPQTIIVSGDLLTQSIKQIIHEAWQAPIYDVYAVAESIYLAIKVCGQGDMVVMDDLNILEVLNHDDRSVSPGESGRAVLTNLYNYTLPILRYELGDSVVLGTKQYDSPFTTIRDINGRINDALPVVLHDGKHDKISPHVLGECNVPGLEKVQYISRRPGYVQIDYIGTQNIDAEIRQEFQRILKLKGASQTTFEVRRVEHIANDPKSGKFPRVKVEKEQEHASETIVDAHSDRPSVQREACWDEGAEPRSKMNRSSDPIGGYHLQQAIIAKCFHPSGASVEFRKEQIEKSITHRFELQATKYADRIAVKTKDQALTYDALGNMANRVARVILAQCGEGNEPVALLLEQSGVAIAAVLGVVKAGKIYVPLDPSHSRTSLAAILEDSQTGIILTDSRNLALAKELASAGCSLVNLDDLDAGLSAENPGVSVSADAVAAIFYTSGSAGQPKGVMQTHRSILHRVMIDTNNFHICPEDRLSLLSSPIYSVSLRNFFGALLNGAAVYPFDVRKEGIAHLADWLSQEKITIYFSVPTVFRKFTETLTGQEDFNALRLIYLAGEGAAKWDVELYKKHFSRQCILVNSLASNEAGIIRQYFIDKETEVEGTIVPAGYGVEDKEVLLLDDAGEEIASGAAGEIAVRSRYVSPGYWRRPELTAAAFLPDSTSGDRPFYLTGDMGRMLPDGCLVHLGRKDTRVKIRGIGVDAAEVEAVLSEHPAIKEAVVVAQEDPCDGTKLVAYAVQSQEHPPAPRELREFLQQKLPDYMIPSAFAFLESWPLTPNGKIDRKSLPSASQARCDDQEYVGPRTPLEKRLTDIWREVLGLERVGIHDDFFELGGHSLSATQVVSRAREIFHMDIPLASLLAEPTVAEMALAILQHQADCMEEGKPGQTLAELEELSEEEAERLLAEQMSKDKL